MLIFYSHLHAVNKVCNYNFDKLEDESKLFNEDESSIIITMACYRKTPYPSEEIQSEMKFVHNNSNRY